MKLIQVDNINQFWNLPLDTNKSPIDLRNTYGERIEGESVIVYDDNNVKYSWVYRGSRYIEIE
jgi:hypothetical protein